MKNEERLLILGSILKKITKIDMKTFDNRLVFQKLVYFLQVFGFDFEYRFNWYIFGPYSSDLAKDGYKLQSKLTKVENIEFVSPEYDKKLSILKKFLDDKNLNPHRLELLASLHFLKRVFPNQKENVLIKIVMSKQTKFTEEECLDTLQYIKRFGI